jgi:alkylation response protein AidB-like acyl-CoA dehydrogenase
VTITDALAPGTLLNQAQALREDLVADAARVERIGVGRQDTAQLAEAGLYGLYAAEDAGGVPAAEQRQVAELLAGASPDLWFVWFQHGPVLKMVASTQNTDLRDRHLAGLTSGVLQGGVSYSHLRTPKPSIFAERDGDAFVLSGTQPWCTGWGVNDLILVGAVVRETDEVVFGIVPSGDSPGLRSSGELSLAAMGGTATHGLVYDGYRLEARDVANVLPYKDFFAVDALANTNVQPSTFGIALAALDLLEEKSPETAEVLRARVLEVRERAYRLIDETPFNERTEERLEVRAQALLLGMESTTALLAARGGQGMDLGNAAQRLLRAAAFQVVHSQAAGIRAATLAALAS